jgi:1-acyl-sn-glycerol-3-phosphate acyltransferase
MKFIRRLHIYYGFVVFAVLFILLFPLLLIPILFPSQFKLVGIINRWWAKLLFVLSFIPFKVVCREKLDPRRQYIFCPNHFSYLDIPTMGLTPVNAIFVGKNEMENIPLFGYMYRKLHITVDRSRLKSRGNTLLQSLKAIDDGKSLIIFPEGGIVTRKPPQMAPFKDGAFRTAIEKQIPIVPVSIPHNWIILPDQSPLRLHGGTIRVIFHQPIETTGYGLDQIKQLKKQVYDAIDSELR